MPLDNGTRVKLVVPWGPNAGKFHGYAVVTGFRYDGMDGLVYYAIMEGDGSKTEISESWIGR